MRINALLVLLGIASATLVAAPAAHAVPAMVKGTYCELNETTNVLFCDRPLQPDGSWIRCFGFFAGSPYDYRFIGVGNDCFRYDPAAPPTLPLGQPNHHVDA
jgi:hypothetical protein